jgi:hypothetical protein
LLAAALLALLGVAGCGDDPGAPADPGAPPPPTGPDTLEVGSGVSSFQVLGDGATVSLNYGAQGGYHIWLSVRCRACGPEVIVSYGVDEASTGELLTFQDLQMWTRLEEQDGWREAVGLTAFLNGNDPSTYTGRRVALWATVAVEGSGDAPLEGAAEAIVSDTETVGGDQR